MFGFFPKSKAERAISKIPAAFRGVPPLLRHLVALLVLALLFYHLQCSLDMFQVFSLFWGEFFDFNSNEVAMRRGQKISCGFSKSEVEYGGSIGAWLTVGMTVRPSS